MSIEIAQQEKQIFSTSQRKFYSNQLTELARCLEISCRFFGLQYDKNGVKQFPANTPLSSQITTAVKQQSLQYVKRAVDRIDINNLACPYILIHKKTQKIALLIPKSQGRALLYLSDQKSFQKIDQLSKTDWEDSGYELLPHYQQSALSLKKLLFWCLLQGNTSALIMYCLMSLVIAVMTMVPPIATGYLINNVIGVADTTVIISIAAILLIFALGAFGLFLLRNILLIRFHTTKRYIMLSGLVGRFFAIPLSFFQKQSSGQAQQILNVFSALIDHAINFATSLGAHIIFICVGFAAMFYFFWQIALAQLVFILIFSVIILLFSWLRKKPLWLSIQAQGKSLDICFQYINAIEKLLTLQKTDMASQICQQSVLDYIFADFSSYLYDVYKTIFTLILQGLSVFITFILVYLLYGESVNLGALISFLGITAIFIGYCLALLGLISNYYAMQIQYKKVNQIFLLDIPEHFGVTTLDVAGEIIMNDISFSYTKESNTLNAITLHIKKGQKVAILGKSGCGKSTLLKLIIGLLYADKGDILIDNNPISTLDLADFCLQVAFFSQKDQLFNGSLKDNITLGEEYPDEQIWQALSFAECDNIIEKLPMKLSSIVSENVSSFSDGEEKRLLLARCMVKQPKMLILDEVLNGLDPETAQKIMTKLTSLDITCILATHNVEGLSKLDYIYYLDKGNIIEQGDFETLMQQKGSFYQKAMNQGDSDD
ncbi:peptidase domain-containing ABC transporter [Facilibium subflavum]|uniref:peptidase domain-containing ABC transporter n=1 Tax=Facilibium subflavum TaxID=2219058 RepID=UPI000E64A0A7|nr:ATP-binding cassette domain-containing protein [Facilibium subflavum]